MFTESNFLQHHTRWIMLVLVLCMGAAMASPLVKPRSLALVCSGAKTVALVDLAALGDPAQLLVMTLDCADCLPVVLPPLDTAIRTAEKPLQGHIVVVKPLPVPETHCLSPPSRGPPIPVSST